MSSLNPKFTNKFKRDLRRAERRNKDVSKLKEIIHLLTHRQPLPPKYHNHPLRGKWIGRWECHIEPDWLLIYKIEGNDLRCERIGTHSDLF